MNKELCDKLNALSDEERDKYYQERSAILNDRVYASIYGITGEDYNNLPAKKVEEAEEKLYNKMFESKNTN